jgi:1,4-dihydroxy-2-naphthoyl-CoA synthase
MALVEEAIVSADGRVRRVMISYRTDEGTKSIVERPVQKLIVIAPKETSCSSTGNGGSGGGGGGVFQISSQNKKI